MVPIIVLVDKDPTKSDPHHISEVVALREALRIYTAETRDGRFGHNDLEVEFGLAPVSKNISENIEPSNNDGAPVEDVGSGNVAADNSVSNAGDESVVPVRNKRSLTPNSGISPPPKRASGPKP